MLRIVLLSAALSAIAESVPFRAPIHEISANSKIGSTLVSKARRLDNNNNYYGENGGDGWLVGYNLKFVSCKETLSTFAGDKNNGGGNDGDGNVNSVSVSRVVQFRLCPSGNKCSRKCSESGLYAVSLEEFVQAYMDNKRQEQEEECEAVRQTCYNDDESVCYSKAGLEYCEEDFEVERYATCAPAERGENGNQNGNQNYYYYANNNNNKNGNSYYSYKKYKCYNDECNLYVGPKCSLNGKGIHLAAFIDEGCSVEAPSGTYEAMNYGYSLPYSSQSMIDGTCMSCKQKDQYGNNNNNYYYYYNNGNGYYNYNPVSEMCEELYASSLKCEENMTVTSSYYFKRDTSSCYYMSVILPRLDVLAKKQSRYVSMTYWGLVPISILSIVIPLKYLHKKFRQSAIVEIPRNDENGKGGYYVSG